MVKYGNLPLSWRVSFDCFSLTVYPFINCYNRARKGRESATCVNMLIVFMLEELKDGFETPIRIICILYLQSQFLLEEEMDFLILYLATPLQVNKNNTLSVSIVRKAS
jgi:hypothetical protein